MTLEEQRGCMEPLQLAGKLIMENGGETYRVEETITRMGQAFGLREVESFAVPSGIFISYRLDNGESVSSVKRVHRGSTNLTRVDRVNSVSRRVVTHGLNAEEAAQELREIEDTQPPRRWMPAAAALCGAGFTLMFGGNAPDFALAFAVAGLAQGISMLLERFHMQALIATLLASLLTTLLPMLAETLWPGFVTEAVIAGALMPLLPGLTMTNAVQDTLRGDMVSGLSSGVLALLIAALVAGGTLIAATCFKLMTGGAV